MSLPLSPPLTHPAASIGPAVELSQPAARGLAVDVHVEGVAYRGIPLFAGFDLSLAAGQTTCLLGPSGVGKTTLLRLIAGLVVPPSGTLIRADDGAPLAGRVAWMAQEDLLLPWLSVLDNATLGARLRGEPLGPAKARARALLAEAGLGEAMDVLPGQLSGGMRQRAALVRTLVEDRPLVLMDEPFSALDAATRLRLHDVAAKLLAGRTVLLVTHDPLEALRLGHRVHVITGTPARLHAAIVPAGAPPRAPAEPELLAHQASLLTLLHAVGEP